MEKEFIIIEDNHLMQMLNEVVLVENGICENISTFENARLALDYLLDPKNSKKTFLVFLDLYLPEITGWAFLENINQSKIKDQIFVIAITSAIRDSERLKTILFKQVVGYFEKPLSNQAAQQILSIPEIKMFFETSQV